MSHTRRTVGFALIPLLGIVTPLVVLPAITSRFGASAWVAIAVGQSIGAALVTIGELGWGLSGPQRVARMGATNAYRLAVLSAQTKCLAFVPLAALALTVGYLVAPSLPMETALIAAFTLLTAFSFAWLFLGISRPWLVIVADGLPRLVGLATAALLILLGAPFIVYPIVGLAIPAAVAPMISILIIARMSGSRSVPIASRRQVIRTMLAQRNAVTARAASATYIALPVTIVGIAAPNYVAVFAAGERLLRMALTAIIALPNAMQGWVGRGARGEDRSKRVDLAILVNVILGTVAGCAFGFFAPWASQLLFSGVATVTSEIAWTFSFVVLIVCASRAVGGIGLVAFGGVHVIALSALAGALVGVPAIFLLSSVWDAQGAVIGEILAEGVVLVIQITGLVLIRRRRST